MSGRRTWLAWGALSALGCAAETPRRPRREPPSPPPAPPPNPAAFVEPPRSELSTIDLHPRRDDMLILMHGYGAPPEDLVPFGQRLHRATRFGVTLATAPFALEGGSNGGRPAGPHAWFARSGPTAQRDLEQARGLLERLLDAERTRGARRLVVGGFSQGGIMALELALMSSTDLAGVVALSPTTRPRWLQPRRTPPCPVFLAHGRSDRVLPFADTEALHARLTSQGVASTFVPFDGDHTIPDVVERGVIAFLAGLG